MLYTRILAAVMLLSATVVMADDRESMFGNSKASKLDQCVEPTADMRRNHMDYLDQHRDDTVLLGIRTKNHSLKNCIDCHVQTDAAGQAIPVNAKDQFCAECHQETAAQLDCFQCHATVPKTSSKAGLPYSGFDPVPGSRLATAIQQTMGAIQ